MPFFWPDSFHSLTWLQLAVFSPRPGLATQVLLYPLMFQSCSTASIPVCAPSHKLRCGKSFLLSLSDFRLLCAHYKTMINMNQGDTNWRGQPAKGHMQLRLMASHWIVIEWGKFCCTCSFTKWCQYDSFQERSDSTSGRLLNAELIWAQRLLQLQPLIKM